VKQKLYIVKDVDKVLCLLIIERYVVNAVLLRSLLLFYCVLFVCFAQSVNFLVRIFDRVDLIKLVLANFSRMCLYT